MVDDSQPGQEILLVTGVSGGGKSTALQVLEDLGWYVVDARPECPESMNRGESDSSR